MADPTIPGDVTTCQDDDTVSASVVVDATPAAIFDFVRRPANHAIISGDRSVKGVRFGPEVLGAGDKFGMSMKLLGVPYRISSRVVEFEEDRCIAWAHVGRHRWRWEVQAAGTGGSTVTETFDLSTAAAPPALRIFGYPGRHLSNVAESVERVRVHFAADA